MLRLWKSNELLKRCHLHMSRKPQFSPLGTLPLEMSAYDSAYARSPFKEALSRTRLDAIFLTTLAQLNPMRGSSAQELNLRFETAMKMEVTYKGKKRELTGQSDYTLFYGNPEDTEGNLFVMEAKKKGDFWVGVPQLLAYMGKQHIYFHAFLISATRVLKPL